MACAVRQARRAAPGFTLIELLVTLAIFATLAAIAVPSFNEAILGNKLAGYANAFSASAQVARSEAIKRNATVVMCRSAAGTGCDLSGGWQQGWIVWRDANGNATVDDGELIQRRQALSADFHFAGNAYSIDFLSTGGAQMTGGGNPVVLSLCRALPAPGSQEREVRVGPTGRVSIDKTTNGACS